MEKRDMIFLAQKARKHVLKMVAKTNSSHIGSCFSIIDILAVLYTEILNYKIDDPVWPQRDRFILSKGHAAAALYAILAEQGFFPIEWLDSYNYHGAKLLGHCTAKGIPGVELSTGSLGHGLPVGLGMAKALQLDGFSSRVFVLLGDGECDEGSIWEAALLAPRLKLNNLYAIVDYNKIQSFGSVEEIIDLEPFCSKWESFGWCVQRIDGHNYSALHTALNKQDSQKPCVIIADTIKGKGVSYMENQLAWHYKSPDEAQLEMALRELESPT